MSNILNLLEQILNEKLPADQVKLLMERLTIASGDGAVAIAGDANGSITITGNHNINGDNNVVIHQGIDAEELVKLLHNLLTPQKVSTQFQSLIADKTEGFVGREYVFNAIQSFINNRWRILYPHQAQGCRSTTHNLYTQAAYQFAGLSD